MGDSTHQVTLTAPAAGCSGATPAGTPGKLEEKVAQTVHAAQAAAGQAASAVKETMHSATEAVTQAAESVAQTVDLSRHVQEHPWLAMGGSVALGFLAAQLLKSALQAAAPSGTAPSAAASSLWAGYLVQPSAQAAGGGTCARPAAAASTQEAAGMGQSFGELASWLGEHLGDVKGFATGSLMNYARALLTRGLDAVEEQLGQRGSPDQSRETPRPQQPTEPPQGAFH